MKRCRWEARGVGANHLVESEVSNDGMKARVREVRRGDSAGAGA